MERYQSRVGRRVRRRGRDDKGKTEHRKGCTKKRVERNRKALGGSMVKRMLKNKEVLILSPVLLLTYFIFAL